MNKVNRKISAFTLTELLVAILVVGVLTGATVGVVQKAKQKAIEMRAPVDIHEMKTALEEYHSDHGSYPPGGIENLTKALEPYMNADPKNIKDGKAIDPWGNPYIYDNPGKINPGGGYDLYSGGRPGAHSIPITTIPRSTSIGKALTSSGTTTTSSGSTAGSGWVLYKFDNPDVLTATPNSGYVHLAWLTMASGSKQATGYNVYRSTALNGSYDKINSQPLKTTEYIDKVPMNDTPYFYKLQAVFSDGWSELSNAVNVTPASDNIYSQKIALAFDALSGSVSGANIAADITKYNVPILFGYVDPSANAVAWFSSALEAIMINVTEKDYSKNVHAALLAHEGTHTQWHFDKTLGTPTPDGTPRSDNSIDQEYNAFLNNTAVWNELKGGETNANLDSWAATIGLGEAAAKADIRITYSDLPEY